MSGSKGKKCKIFYSNKFGYILCQQNGQRTYGGPPPNWGSRPAPSRDCEVFIGRLPRLCFEDELIPLFLTAGELYEFRLMLDFSGTNRGYGYAHYATEAEAQKAIETLNKFEIRPGHQIGVLKSKNNCRLLFGNIAAAMKIQQFNNFIRINTDQVLKVLIFKNFQQLKRTDFRISSEVEEAFLARVPRSNVHKEFAIVEYENHKAAAVARRILIPKYGQILAIDWAVPPRERKRFGAGSDSQVQLIERPLTKIPVKDSNVLLVSKTNAKVRPVPVLLVRPSPLDNVAFISKPLKMVVIFFKYQLSICLYKCVDQLEIPLFICKEIERKIVDRVTNLENCSQAVQLIFNYFSWYNEKKRFIINLEVQNLLQEVKIYGDTFVSFINRRLKNEPSQNPEEEFFFINILPLNLIILFRIILRSDVEVQAKLSSGITKSLVWLYDVKQNGGEPYRQMLKEILNLVQNDDTNSLEKASSLAKSLFLNTITAHQQSQGVVNSVLDFSLLKNVCKSGGNTLESELEVEDNSRHDGNQRPTSAILTASDIPHGKDDSDHYVQMTSPQARKFNEEIAMDIGRCPPVPLLPVQSSILNKVPFMPDIFDNIPTYFKYLIRICVNISALHMNIPQQISDEIERKVVNRISNLQNCSEGVQMILDYFSWWVSKDLGRMNLEVHRLLQEVKNYSDSFVIFVWSKAMSSFVPKEDEEEYFCKVLPLRLNILFQVMLILNSEYPKKYLIGIGKGLAWIEELTEKGEETAKLFLEELTRFIVGQDQTAFERAKVLGKVCCAELLSCSGQSISFGGTFVSFVMDDKNCDGYSSPINTEIPTCLSVNGNDNTSEVTSDS